jgi:hypothetical protein
MTIQLKVGDIVLYLWNRDPNQGPVNPPHCVWPTYQIIDNAQKWCWLTENAVMHVGIFVGEGTLDGRCEQEKNPNNTYTSLKIAHVLWEKGGRISHLEKDHPFIVVRPKDEHLAKLAAEYANLFCEFNVDGKAKVGYSKYKAVASLIQPRIHDIAPEIDDVANEVWQIVGGKSPGWHCSEAVVKAYMLAAKDSGLNPYDVMSITHVISPHNLAKYLLNCDHFNALKSDDGNKIIFMFPETATRSPLLIAARNASSLYQNNILPDPAIKTAKRPGCD